MRYVVIGPGAVGGTLGALLGEAGHPVTVVARGAHAEALAQRGLTLRQPERTLQVQLEVVRSARDADIAAQDVVLLAVKAQDAAAALASIPAHATVVCTQNGVMTEALAAAHVARVIAAMVWIPAVHLVPGEVEVHAQRPSAVMRLGPFPEGGDAHASDAIAAELRAADVDATSVADVLSHKRGKLLSNLANVLDAFVVPEPGLAAIAEAAVAEASAVLRAAGLSFVPYDELLADMRGRIAVGASIDGRLRPGGSTWQSAQRGKPTEVDVLNGWVCRQGAAVGVPTPVNAGLARLASEAEAPRSVPLARLQGWMRSSIYLHRR